jgi:DNA-binding SARP family transcriptional activator/tetratricopeptide (TPR) repeat protein
VEFAILGRTALHVDGQPVALGAAKQRAMLALLLYYARVPVRIDTLVDVLWGDHRDLPAHRSSLYALVSRTRHILKYVGIPDALVRIGGVGGYRLDVDPDTVDFHRFKRLVAEAREAVRQHRHADAAAVLTTAVGLWGDEPLADLRGPHAERLRDRMNDSLVDAHKLLADSQLSLGQHQPVLARLEPFLLERDLDEALAQHWITALCAAGRSADARAFLTAFRKRFRRQMRAESAVSMPFTAGPTRASTAAAMLPVGPTSPTAAIPRQLPLDIGDFAGHGDLLAELDSLTRPGGAVTNVVVLAGMPGVGKTTMAVHWAHRNSSNHPDGQLYFNANAFGPGPGGDPTTALGRFLVALGEPAEAVPPGPDERRHRLTDILADRRVLFVLDNVRDSVQARQMLPTSPHCVTIVTSRNRLRGLCIREGARCLTVTPLTEPDAVALLAGIIGTARADAEPTAVRELARLTSGLPLALRIAGEHVAARPQLPIAGMVDELATQLLSSDGDDDANLRTVFAWSYDALAPAASRLFRLLGLHPGPTISADAAAALLDVGTSTADGLLQALARAHLINYDAVDRFRLHDLVRRFAAERAHSEEPPEQGAAATDRLLRWYLWSATNAAGLLAPDRGRIPDLPEPGGVRPLTFATDSEALDWCDAERANVGPITRWAVAAGFHRFGWQIPGTLHGIYDRYGRRDDILELCSHALVAARLDNHLGAQTGTLINEGSVHFARGDYARAAACFTTARHLAGDAGDPDAEAASLHNLASISLKTGAPAAAIEIYLKVLDICRRTANKVGESSTLHRLGTAYRQEHRFNDAVTHYQQALAIRTTAQAIRGQGETHAALGALYNETGDLTLALRHCRRAIELAGRMRDDVVRCDALTTAAEVERALTMHLDAVRDAEDAVTISDEIGDHPRRTRALAVLAEALAASGQPQAAAQVRNKAMPAFDYLPEAEAKKLRGRGQPS